MPDDSALLRHLKLVLSLSARSAHTTLRDLARDLEVSEKTVTRDLALLTRAGFRFDKTLGDHGRKQYQLAQAAALPALSLDWQEAMSMWLARAFLKPLTGTHFGISADRAFGKLRAVLGDLPLGYIEKMARAFHVTAGDGARYATQAGLIDELDGAIADCLMTDLRYRSQHATEAASRTVYPLGWVWHSGALYLVAHAPEHDEQRLYKVDRMEVADVLKLKFIPPPDFSMARYLADAIGVYRGDGRAAQTVRIRFLPAVARAVQEKRYHASQRQSPERDGSVTAEFTLAVTPELKSWLLSWGANAVVLEPEELADDLRRTAADLLRHYAPDRPPSRRVTSKPRKPRPR